MIDELISDVDTNSLRFSLEGVHGLLSSLALCGAGGGTAKKFAAKRMPQNGPA